MIGRFVKRCRTAVAVLVAVVAVAGPVAGARLGAVVGTAEVNIRSCPSLSCDVLDVVPLGSPLEIAGETVDGFVPVRLGDLAGYAYGLYVAPDPASAPYLVEGEPGCNRVALIFNVGIGEEPVTDVLDTLAAREAPATIFPMGWWAAEYPGLLRRMADDGLVIGSHGDQPIEPTRRPDAEVVADLRSAAAAIEEALGEPPGPWFTPYAAAMDERVRALVAREGYLPVAWTVPAADYGADVTAEDVYRRVMDHVYDGAIVELHLDGPATATSTAVALPWLIDDLRAAGYELVTIPEMAAPCEP